MAGDVVSRLTEVLDDLAATDPGALGEGDTVVALLAAGERLGAVAARAAAAFDASRAWEADGARSCGAWLAATTRQPASAVKRRVRLGRHLREMGATEAAWVAGEIGQAHVEALARARHVAGDDAFGAAEAFLVGEARELRYRDFVRALAYWEQSVAPEGTEERAEAQRAGRRLHLSQSFEGNWFLDGMLDPLGGAIVSQALGAIEEELFTADWAEARERVGEGVCADDLARTPAQRRADAVVEMARRSQAVAPGAQPPRPLLTVLVGYETLHGRICELADGTVVTPGQVVPWLSEAQVERVVFGPKGRPIDVGERRRLFEGATRRAIEVRDRRCYHRYCEVPGPRCQVDHILPWAAGGPTTVDNGRLACEFHNRLRHRRPPPAGDHPPDDHPPEGPEGPPP